jgi:hypothetical protein
MTKEDLITKDDLKRAILEAVEELKGYLNQLSTSQPHSKKKYLRNKDLKEIFGFSENKIREMRNKKQIPYSKLGGTYFYDSKKIDKILDANRSDFNR